MSNKLSILESKKLFKEFNYLMSDVDFKNEFAKEYGKGFEDYVRKILQEEPIFKQACKDKFGDLLKNEEPPTPTVDAVSDAVSDAVKSDSTDVVIFTGQTTSYESIITLEPDDKKLKDLYRKIAQKTHPDKVKSDALNELYVRATEANKRKDVFTMYAICSELSIKFDITPQDIKALKNQINLIKVHQVNFEHSHFWVWANTEREDKKVEIVRHFLINHAPSVKTLFT